MRPKLFAFLIGAALIGILSAAPVAAGQPERYPPPDRYGLGPPSDWTITGACTFDVNVHPLVDRRYEIDFFGNGRPVVLITGTQKVELTNADTGTTIVLNTGGPYWLSTNPLHAWLNGHSLVGDSGYLWWRMGHLDAFDIGGDSPGRVVDVCALLAQ
jgi:hypothetical protein